MSFKRQVPAAAAVALALSLAAPLAAHADAMRVVLDPKTGELRGPTAAEAAAFERAEAQLRAEREKQGARGTSAAKVVPREIRYADGTIENVLGEDTHLFSVVSTDAQGNLNFDCLPANEAKKYVKAGGRKAPARTVAVNKTAKVAP
jgi:hypothetical protein